MRRLKSAVAVAVAMGLVASVPLAVTGQDAGDPAEAADVGVASPGPLGRLIGDWGAEWLTWWIGSLPHGLECGTDSTGAVVFPPLYQRTNRFDFESPEMIESECTMRSDQHILLPVGPVICHTDESLAAQAKEAKGKKRKALQRSVDGNRLWTFDCIASSRSRISKPFVSVDDVAIAVDGSSFALTTPFVAQQEDYPRVDFVPLPSVVIGSGDFVILEPLDLGSHMIEWGWRRDYGPGYARAVPFENLVRAEVVGTQDE